MGPDRLYFFASQLLLERISWICRDAHKRRKYGNGKCALVFSKRASLDYKKFQEYAREIQRGQSKYGSHAAWEHINLRAIFSRPHADGHDGLLAVDHIASAYGAAVEYNPYGLNDDHNVRPLARNCYRPDRGKRWKNGLKMFPKEAEPLIKTDPRLWWVREHYDG